MAVSRTVIQLRKLTEAEEVGLMEACLIGQLTSPEGGRAQAVYLKLPDDLVAWAAKGLQWEEDHDWSLDGREVRTNVWFLTHPATSDAP